MTTNPSTPSLDDILLAEGWSATVRRKKATPERRELEDPRGCQRYALHHQCLSLCAQAKGGAPSNIAAWLEHNCSRLFDWRQRALARMGGRAGPGRGDLPAPSASEAGAK